VEAPNVRGGESGISRLTLPSEQGQAHDFFVKRQSGYCTRTFRHPFSGEPTLAREFRSLNAFRRYGVGVAKPLFYKREKNSAVLVLESLGQSQSLDNWLQNKPSMQDKKKVIQALAHTLKQLHQAGWMHNCLYPKHVFVKIDTEVKIDFIDLEKARYWPLGKRRSIRDLETLNFHTLGVPLSLRLRFFKAYVETTKSGSPNLLLIGGLVLVGGVLLTR